MKTLIRLSSLIRAFAGRTCHFVGFVVLRLKYKQAESQGKSSFPEDCYQAILNKANKKSKTNGKRKNYDNYNKTTENNVHIYIYIYTIGIKLSIYVQENLQLNLQLQLRENSYNYIPEINVYLYANCSLITCQPNRANFILKKNQCLKDNTKA